MRLLTTLSLIFGLAVAGPALAGAPLAREATLYKNPQCDCCEGHAKYLRENAFEVKVVATHDLQIGRPHVCTPDTNAPTVCLHPLDKNNQRKILDAITWNN